MITTVLMDGDGSTLTSQSELPENLLKLILEHEHINWIMATGRSLDLLKLTPIFPHLSSNVPHIVSGGAKIMKLDGTVIKEHNLSDAELEIFFNNLKLDAIDFLYYSPDGIKQYGFSQDQNILNKFGGHKIVTIDSIQQFKLLVYNIRPSNLLVRVNDRFNPEDFSLLNYNRNENNIDLTPYGINKGSACLYLLDHLSLKPENVLFIFNDYNDLPLVEKPELENIIKLKVGDRLPHIIADYKVNTPFDVADILSEIIK